MTLITQRSLGIERLAFRETMTTADPSYFSSAAPARIIICSPQQDEAKASVQTLQAAGFATVTAAEPDGVLSSLGEEAAVLLLAAELLTPRRLDGLVSALEQCRTVPGLLIMAPSGQSDDIQRISAPLNALSQPIVLTRPVAAATLTSAAGAVLTLQSRLRQNQKLSTQLEKSEQQRETLLGTLNHELRNPLAAISNAVDLLGQVNVQHPRLVTARQILARQTEQMTTVLQRLLNGSRPDREKIAASQLAKNRADPGLEEPAKRVPGLPAQPDPDAPPSSLQILVVDDNQDAAKSLGLLLEGLGHRIRLAYDGHSALELAYSRPPQALLLDLDLPQLDGYKIAQRLRQDARFAQVLFIAITGYGGSESQRRTQAAGFDYHLTKPVSLDTLQTLLLTAPAN